MDTNSVNDYVDVDGIDDHHCLGVIACYVDVDGIDDHHCLEVIDGIEKRT
jgi:hypothetical protein